MTAVPEEVAKMVKRLRSPKQFSLSPFPSERNDAVITRQRDANELECEAAALLQSTAAELAEVKYDRDALVDSACEQGCSVSGGSIMSRGIKAYVTNYRAEAAEALSSRQLAVIRELTDAASALVTDVENKWGDPHTLRHTAEAVDAARALLPAEEQSK